MTPIQLALLRAQELLLARIAELGTRIADGDETAWSPFCEAARALAAIAPQTVPGGHGEFITTRQLADRLGLAPKTVLRRAKKEGVEPIRFAKRGHGARIVGRRGPTYKCVTQAGATMYRVRPEVGIAADAWRRVMHGYEQYGLTAASRPKVESDVPIGPVDRLKSFQESRLAEDRATRFFGRSAD